MYMDTKLNDTGVARGSNLGRCWEFFFSPPQQSALGPTHPPIQWVSGNLSLEVKRPERESDHPPPSSVEVKNAWNCTSIPPYVFMA